MGNKSPKQRPWQLNSGVWVARTCWVRMGHYFVKIGSAFTYNAVQVYVLYM